MKNTLNDTSEDRIYADILSFYETIAAWKETYKRALTAVLPPPAIDADVAAIKLKSGFPLIDKARLELDEALIKPHFLSLLDIVGPKNPQEAQAIALQVADQNSFRHLLTDTLRYGACADHSQLLRFLLQETVHSLLEAHADFLAGKIGAEEWHCGYCPMCGSNPMLGVLKGQEGKKYLICEACLSEWPFSRSRCSRCGTASSVKMAYFTVQDDERYRVETCDACKRYLKVIDQRGEHPEKSAPVANLTTLHLDIIAVKKGYAPVTSFFQERHPTE